MPSETKSRWRSMPMGAEDQHKRGLSPSEAEVTLRRLLKELSLGRPIRGFTCNRQQDR